MSSGGKGRRKGRVGAALKSFGGFMTALAAIATAVAAILGARACWRAISPTAAGR